jgi:Tol biopolymer transport system component
MGTRSLLGPVGAGALLAAALPGPTAGQVTERMSVDSSGAQGNGSSFDVSISADGRHVAFASASSNLVSGDTNGVQDVFVRDRQGGTTQRVSVDSSGAQGNGNSSDTSISADGRYVAFRSAASNLVSGDTNEDLDVFVHDRQNGTTERVSIRPGGAQGNGHSYYPSISTDGRYVAFWSYASLVAGDTNGTWDIFVRDRQDGTTERVSVDSFGTEGDGTSLLPSISGDGRHVAFESVATNLVSGDSNQSEDVFVRDRQGGTTERVSLGSSGEEGDDNSGSPSITADGRYVAFESLAMNLVSGDTNGAQDIFVRDRQGGTTERVSVDSSGAQGNSSSYSPAISADGRYVAFYSLADNLVDGDTNVQWDVFVHDRQSGMTECASLDSLGNQADGNSDDPAISADGRYVVFKSEARNLVSGDTNMRQDVFLRDRNCDFAATAATFSGDGINADLIAPLEVVLGSSWSAPLTLGHPHGAGGPLSLSVRSATINGPSFASPLGGRPTEVLIAGQFLATLAGSHDGMSGDIPPQTIPAQLSLVGTDWAAQYTVVGGGFADLSQAVYGVVGCP